MKTILAPLFLLTLAATTTFARGYGDRTLPGRDGILDMEALLPSEEGVVQVEVAAVAVHDFLGRFSGDTLFLPAAAVCDFLQYRAQVSDDLVTFSGELAPGIPFEISRDGNVATVGGQSFPFGAAQIRVVRGDMYIDQALLFRLLGLSASYDFEQLRIRIVADRKIPLVSWRRGEDRYAAMQGGSPLSQVVGDEIAPDRSLLGGLMLNWSLSNSTIDASRTGSSGRLRLGGELLFGTFELGMAGSYTGGLEPRASGMVDTWRWQYGMPSFSPLRRITLGTVVTQNELVKGVEISNAPLAPRTAFGTYRLEGQSRPGWFVELYEGERLVDVARADSGGRYALSVPVGYGTTDRLVRQIGPSGEVIVERKRLQLGDGMAPAGVVEYTATLGLTSLDDQGAPRGAAVLRAGLGDNLTVGGDVRYSNSSRSFSIDSLRPSIVANGWFLGSLSATARYALNERLASAEIGLLTSGSSTLRLGVDSLSVEQRSYTGRLSGSLPLGAITLAADARYEHGLDRRSLDVTPRISGYLGGVSFDASYSLFRPLESSGTSVAPVMEQTARLRLLASPLVGLLLGTSARYDFERRNLAAVGFETYYRFTNAVALGVTYNVSDLDWKRGVVGAQVTVDLPSMRMNTFAMRQDERTSTIANAQGGMAIGAGGITTGALMNVGTAALIVAPFNDRNANGMRDDGEEPLAAQNIHMMINGSEQISSDGIFRSVPAWRECEVVIDRWSMSERGLFPGQTTYRVRTVESGVHLVEVPFSAGFDVYGLCEFTRGGADTTSKGYRPALTGLRVRLVSDERGISYDGEVFSDGSVYVPAVAQGTYRIVLDEHQLESRRLCVEKVPAIVIVGEGTTRLDDFQLTVCQPPTGQDR